MLLFVTMLLVKAAFTIVTFFANVLKMIYEPLFAKRPPPFTAVLAPDFVTSMSEIWASLQYKVTRPHRIGPRPEDIPYRLT
eukprot:3455553-Pyramimonas_sp.AAC.2